MSPRFCGVPAFLKADAATWRWNKRHLRACLTGLVQGISAEQQAAVTQAVFRVLEAACGLTFALTAVPGEADILMGSGTLDGRGNVLAWSEVAGGDDRPLRQLYELDEGWSAALSLTELKPGEVPLFITRLHEVGHALGLGHATDPTDVMAPALNFTNWKPAGWFLAELRARYGPPIEVPPPVVGGLVELDHWFAPGETRKNLVSIADIQRLEDYTGHASYPGAHVRMRAGGEFRVRQSYEVLKQLLASITPEATS